jgi:hypothetical protein
MDPPVGGSASSGLVVGEPSPGVVEVTLSARAG